MNDDALNIMHTESYKDSKLCTAVYLLREHSSLLYILQKQEHSSQKIQ